MERGKPNEKRLGKVHTIDMVIVADDEILNIFIDIVNVIELLLVLQVFWTAGCYQIRRSFPGLFSQPF